MVVHHYDICSIVKFKQIHAEIWPMAVSGTDFCCSLIGCSLFFEGRIELVFCRVIKVASSLGESETSMHQSFQYRAKTAAVGGVIFSVDRNVTHIEDYSYVGLNGWHPLLEDFISWSIPREKPIKAISSKVGDECDVTLPSVISAKIHFLHRSLWTFLRRPVWLGFCSCSNWRPRGIWVQGIILSP